MDGNIATLEDLKELIQKEGDWFVSIFIPTHRISQHAQEDQIKFKNLVSEAKDLLEEQGCDAPSKLLEPAEKLMTDREFWRGQLDGLALFISEDTYNYYCSPIRVEQYLSVSNRFHIKPLIPLISGRQTFHILGLSQNDTRLYECSRFSIEEKSLGDTPNSLEAALAHDEQEKQLQFHTGTGESDGRRSAMFHGHGVGKDDSKDRIFRFCQVLDKGLQQIIDPEKSTLVIASVDYLAPIFKEASGFKKIMDEIVTGNPEGADLEELRAQAWDIVAPYFMKGIDESLERFGDLSSTGRASTDLKEVVKGAINGRIDTLFVDIGKSVYGSYNHSTFEVEYGDSAKKHNTDLVDLAAGRSLINGGVVYALEEDRMPEGAALGAIFRY
jgi:hypothetical protein